MSESLLQFDLQLTRGDFSLSARGEIAAGITALFGHSGCGKTTLLRCLAGLEPEVRGEIRQGEAVWLSAQKRLPAHQRRASMVFQDNRLFAHLTTAQNLDYALKRGRGDGPSRDEVIAVLGLENLLERLPSQLSGGEVQRVALARAVLCGPSLLLMDEPLAALDYGRRRQIMPLIRAIPERFGLPVLYVTHARYEVLDLADQVMLMEDGRLMTTGSVADVFSSPECWQKLGGLDPMVVWDGTVVAHDTGWGLTTIATEAGPLRFAGLRPRRGERRRVRIAARDVVLMLNPPPTSSLINGLPVKVELFEQHGGVTRVKLIAGEGAPLWAEISQQAVAALGVKKGQRMHALISPQVLGVDS